jgi:arylsulfatase A-like enzyme
MVPLFLYICVIRCASTVASNLPHLILAVIDDLGIDDTSIRVPGSTLPTPNGVLSPHIESLASSGIILTDWHVFKFCSPSRSQMLTGRYAYHLGQQTQMNLNPDGARCGIKPGLLTEGVSGVPQDPFAPP